MIYDNKHSKKTVSMQMPYGMSFEDAKWIADHVYMESHIFKSYRIVERERIWVGGDSGLFVEFVLF